MAKRSSKAAKMREIVTLCDRCGGVLPRTCERSEGSYVCANGDRVPAEVMRHVQEIERMIALAEDHPVAEPDEVKRLMDAMKDVFPSDECERNTARIDSLEQHIKDRLDDIWNYIRDEHAPGRTSRVSTSVSITSSTFTVRVESPRPANGS